MRREVPKMPKPEKNVSQKETMGKRSREKIEKEFNRQIVVNKYLEQINK